MSLLIQSYVTASAFFFFFFFFNDTATTEIYTLSLHDALPISDEGGEVRVRRLHVEEVIQNAFVHVERACRSEEHTSELQSLAYLVCRLLLEKKKQTTASPDDTHRRPDKRKRSRR